MQEKRYVMNSVSGTTTVALPHELVDYQSLLCGITPEQFVKDYRVVAHFSNGDSVTYTFERKPTPVK
jgi:hypothetical protein